ncbi:tyrosine-type recombinase/integrase [Microvirga sp. CF3016]|uniref:tyrosine-type recombinase/integrase n=1 Tax=Microvirga sp. CF3016 TaxID=3110181 RepID=UPI002E75DEDA|nr:integrase arm-type DNA-binding domain-containing protein [Microvirga sp. CF3016]MEE1611894.1 integrase arm-type DNA-binding domain-containing protein [Microvirga sp. CF3016]
MKGRGKHPDRALTAVQIRNLKQPGRYADGNGLYVVVDPSGAKRWLLRVVVRGRRRDIGLGGLSLVSLSEARETAQSYRKLARRGGDPLDEKRKQRRDIPTFAQAAEQVHAEHKPSWRNDKHARQWINTLQQYVLPLMGGIPVDRVETPDILRVLAPIWLTKPETARRVRQRIGTVLDWAKAAGFRTGDNPISGVGKGLPKQTGQDDHHAALPYTDVPEFMQRLRGSDAGEMTRLAFEFLVLTASRTSEVREARWSEFSETERLWTVPAERMKSGRAHRVPLSHRCLEILKRAKALGGGSAFVFPGRSRDKPMSNMVFLMLLRRMNQAITAHGFRSSFRDWAAETTSLPREVAEMALAHAVENKVEAAYRRGDLLEKRRQLMEHWAHFVAGEVEANEAERASKP